MQPLPEFSKVKVKVNNYIHFHILGKVRPRYDRVILLVRNIYDALNADFNRRYGPQHNHTSVANESLYRKGNVRAFALTDLFIFQKSLG